MGKVTRKIVHSGFEKTKFDALSAIHRLEEDDGFIVATLRKVDGCTKAEAHCSITPQAARWLFLSLFESPEIRRAASFVLSSFEKMNAEEIPELLEALDSSMAEEDAE